MSLVKLNGWMEKRAHIGTPYETEAEEGGFKQDRSCSSTARTTYFIFKAFMSS